VPTGWEIEAKRLAASGNRIAAIKAVRDATHLGLPEATAVVEQWGREQS
jgi:ribosomal protein L7/L12